MFRQAGPREEPGLAPFAALHAALQRRFTADTEDTATQQATLDEALGEAAAGEPSAVLAAMTRDEVRTEVGTRVVESWMRQSPAAAAEWLAAHPWITTEQGEALGHALAGDRAALDAIGAVLPGGPLNDAIRAAAASALADQAPAEAARVAATLSTTERRRDALETVVYAWTAKDPVAAEHFIGGIDDPALRQELLAVSAKNVAGKDPDLAMAWLAGTDPAAHGATEALAAVAALWGAQSPKAAAAWVAGLSPGDVRTRATDALVEQWNAQDPAALRTWIEAQPDRMAILDRLAVKSEERLRPKED